MVKMASVRGVCHKFEYSGELDNIVGYCHDRRDGAGEIKHVEKSRILCTIYLV